MSINPVSFIQVKGDLSSLKWAAAKRFEPDWRTRSVFDLVLQSIGAAVVRRFVPICLKSVKLYEINSLEIFYYIGRVVFRDDERRPQQVGVRHLRFLGCNHG